MLFHVISRVGIDFDSQDRELKNKETVLREQRGGNKGTKDHNSQHLSPVHTSQLLPHQWVPQLYTSLGIIYNY